MDIFLILDTTYTSSGEVSNKVRHPYWFPDKKVANGDFVVLHTKAGKNSEAANKADSVTHHFYWGLKSFIWNNDGDCALLLHIDDWTHKKVEL